MSAPKCKPKVIIVGAGLGGITLGILLDKAGLDYDIYEKHSSVKPLGYPFASAWCLYNQLKSDGNLHPSDGKPLPFRYVSVGGQALFLSPDDFPELKREDSPSSLKKQTSVMTKRKILGYIK
ncbi:hypothetical protein BGZ81_007874 [Podila clonocystis]|nr:hypothetical protein BGZ81_007874 [Podila clonocystis]